MMKRRHPKLAESTLRQIAKDARVDYEQFASFVNFGSSIVIAVSMCRDIELTKRCVAADKNKSNTYARRQAYADLYAETAWRYDER